VKTGDSRSKGGFVFPFQAHNPKWDVDKRPALIGKRVVDRLDHDNELGHFVDQEGTYGDLMGAFIAYANGQARSCPSWNFALPVILKGGKKGSTQAAPAGANFGGVANLIHGSDPGGGGGGGSAQAVPIGASPDQPDGRMSPIGVAFRVLEAEFAPVPKPAGAPGGAGGGGNPGVLQLGIGAQVVPVSGGAFPSFGGVRVNFSNGGPQAGAVFQGVRQNFSRGKN
jgi:hypothetical protein